MKDGLKYAAIAVLILSFFCIMSRIDFIVHGTLYDYGLHFSYDWALEYWVLYPAAFVIFALAAGFMFWLGSGKTPRDLKYECNCGQVYRQNCILGHKQPPEPGKDAAS